MGEFESDTCENIPRDAVVTAIDYADGQRFALHRHNRGQFAYAACGVITVFTASPRLCALACRRIVRFSAYRRCCTSY